MYSHGLILGAVRDLQAPKGRSWGSSKVEIQVLSSSLLHVACLSFLGICCQNTIPEITSWIAIVSIPEQGNDSNQNFMSVHILRSFFPAA